MASLIAGETLRILLISAQERTRDEVEGALAGRAGDYRLYWVAQADLAAARGQDMLPHIVLVDDELDGAGPAPLIGQLAGRLPGAVILAFVPASDMDLARRVVLAGARSFLTKPLNPEELVAALRQVLATRQGRRAGASTEGAPALGRTVVFCAPKGGTGRTTLAVNTAVLLHQVTHQSVVLVDADYAAPAVDVALNLPGQRTVADLLPKMAQLDRELVDYAVPEHLSGIRALLAPPPGELAADQGNPIPLPQVQQTLVWLKRMFSWVVVDLGLPLGETGFGYLDGADRIVMTVLPEMVGLRNTRLMLDQLEGRGYGEAKVWLVLNRANLRGGVSVADIEERLRINVAHRFPDDQALATYSINRGIPFTISHRHSAVAQAIARFAKTLAAEGPQAEPRTTAQAMGGLIGRLRGRARPTSA